MAEGKIRVKFEAKGNEALVAAVKALNRETKKLTGTTKNYNATGQRTARTAKDQNKSFTAMGGTLSVLRSKFLLYGFAVQQVSSLLIDVTKRASEFTSLETAFDDLTEASGLNADTINALGNAVDGTVSKMDLMKQANNAMLLGIFDSTEQMAEMFDVAQRLGKALGQNTTQSIESLVTGLGRQSKLMLDNLGIVFSVEKAYEDYAIQLGKTTEALTDQERKQAFVNKALKEAKTLVSDLSDEQFTFADVLSLWGSAFTNLMTETLPNFLGWLAKTAPALDVVGKKMQQVVDAAENASNVGRDFGEAWDMNQLSENFEIIKTNFKTSGEVMEIWNQDAETLLNDFWINRHTKNLDQYAIEQAQLEEALLTTLGDTEAYYIQLGLIEDHFDNLRSEKKKRREAKVVSATLKSSADLLLINKKNAKHAAALQATAAVVDAYSAAQSQFTLTAKVLPTPFPQIAFGATLATGLAQAAQVLKASEVMEQGGLIGGKRHSQGGTMINAERGEFVMSRNAVNAIGVENLNAMNQGSSGGGAVTVNINGGLITPEFVENDLAEAIREGVRRGADFGIS